MSIENRGDARNGDRPDKSPAEPDVVGHAVGDDEEDRDVYIIEPGPK